MKSKKANTETPAPNIQDVSHETVSPTNGHDVVKAEVMTEEQVISTEIQKFKVSDARIAELNEQYGKLEITGPDDKTGYEAVKSAWNEVRSTRTGLEKTGVDLRRRFTAITKGIIKEEDRLISELTPLEKKLYDRWKKIDDDKEAVKQAKEKAEQEKLLERIRELTEAGIVQVDGFYTIGGTIAVDVATLRGLDEKRYNQLLGAVRDKKTELDEAARLEAEKIAQDKAEAEKLRLQLEELNKQKLEAEQSMQRMKDEAAKMNRNANAAKLIGLGMVGGMSPNGAGLIYFIEGHEPIVVLNEKLDLPADEFKLLHSDVAEEIRKANEAAEKRKAEKEKEEADLAARKEGIAEAMQAIGFKYNYQSKAFEFANEFHRAGYSLTVLLEMDPEQFEKMRLSEAAHILNATRQQEQARQDAQTDEANFVEYLYKLQAVPIPAIRANRNVMADLRVITDHISKFIEDYEQE